MRLIPINFKSLRYTGVLFREQEQVRVGTIVNAQYVHSIWFGNYLRVQIEDSDGILKWLPEDCFDPIYPYTAIEKTVSLKQ